MPQAAHFRTKNVIAQPHINQNGFTKMEHNSNVILTTAMANVLLILWRICKKINKIHQNYYWLRFSDLFQIIIIRIAASMCVSIRDVMRARLGVTCFICFSCLLVVGHDKRVVIVLPSHAIAWTGFTLRANRRRNEWVNAWLKCDRLWLAVPYGAEHTDKHA